MSSYPVRTKERKSTPAALREQNRKLAQEGLQIKPSDASASKQKVPSQPRPKVK